ncbi:hypothetical protein [Prevotella koreensis]
MLRRQDSFFIERRRNVAEGGGDIKTRDNCDREHVQSINVAIEEESV